MIASCPSDSCWTFELVQKPMGSLYRSPVCNMGISSTSGIMLSSLILVNSDEVPFKTNIMEKRDGQSTGELLTFE